MDRKKILIGIGLIALVVLIGTALYFAFFRRAPVEAPPVNAPPELIPINAPLTPGIGVAPPIPGALIAPTVNAPPAEAPGEPTATAIAQGGRTMTTTLTETPAAFARIANDGRPQFYDPISGRFYRLDTDGNAQPLSERQFPNVQSTAWAPNATQAILEFPDGANVLYDFKSDKQVTLPSHWEDFSFDPNGDRIAGKSIGLDRENRSLFEATPDGNGFRAIESLGTNARRVDVSWSPNNQVIAFARTGNEIGDGRQQILLIGRNGENFPALTVEGINFRSQWSPTGSRILYSDTSDTSDYKPELWVVSGVGDSIGANRQRLRINTWADKCTFADDATVYCAVPERLDRGAGLVPDIAASTPDTIERIDLATGLRTTIGRPADDLTIAQLQVAPDGGKLYFTTAQDGRLREMRLK